jgi:hypothetical protein
MGGQAEWEFSWRGHAPGLPDVAFHGPGIGRKVMRQGADLAPVARAAVIQQQ